jgi:hypothetical protein
MARRRALKRVWSGWLLSASVLLLAALVAFATLSPLDTERVGTAPSAGTSTSALQNVTPRAVGGMKAYRDPVTGERVGPPPGALPPSAPQPSALSRSQVGLEAVPGQTAAGGIRVDLKGRFRSSLVATKQPDGRVSTRCVHELPEIRGER